MGFFSKLFKGTPRPRPSERVPALAPLVAACATDPRSMWPAFAAGLRGQWEMRIDATAAVVDHYVFKQPAAQRQGLIDGLVAQDPASWTNVRATYYMKLAFDARRGNTSAKDDAAFNRLVDAALPDIYAALRNDPQDPGPCVTAMTLGRMADDQDLCGKMHADGLRRAPACYAVHRAYSDQISSRWGGSHKTQLDHARRIAAESPDASLGAGLPINALYFHLSHIVQFDKDQAGMQAFARRPEVLQELRGVCARSIAHPQHVVHTATFDLRTKATLIAMSGGDVDQVRALFPLLQDVFIDNPWRQLNPDPQPMFDMYRKMYAG